MKQLNFLKLNPNLEAASRKKGSFSFKDDLATAWKYPRIVYRNTWLESTIIPKPKGDICLIFKIK